MFTEHVVFIKFNTPNVIYSLHVFFFQTMDTFTTNRNAFLLMKTLIDPPSSTINSVIRTQNSDPGLDFDILSRIQLFLVFLIVMQTSKIVFAFLRVVYMAVLYRRRNPNQSLKTTFTHIFGSEDRSVNTTINLSSIHNSDDVENGTCDLNLTQTTCHFGGRRAWSTPVYRFVDL